MFLTYGVTGAADLAAVTWQEEASTDPEALAALYDALVSADAFGEGELLPEQETEASDYGDPVWLEAANGLRWMAYYNSGSGLFCWLGNFYSVGTDFLPAAAA